MQLSLSNLKNIHKEGLEIPSPGYFDLPEKVVQFGTGVLLRGLPDYFIDNANKQGIFNGRILVIKSTTQGNADEFKRQDNLYTQCIRSVQNGKLVERDIINASISRVLSARSEWNQILDAATNPGLQLIISNTTEVGIVAVDDDIHATPPASFPGKLLAFLYRRYHHFKGDKKAGLVIIPTELIPDNASTLKKILLDLANKLGLEKSFLLWLDHSNSFCNSLVDRIVPGKLPEQVSKKLKEKSGYADELAFMSESYGLWAIETTDEKVKDVLSFHQCDPGVIIAPDIRMYRELKLRLLNGSHTFCCGLGFLGGYGTVRDAMSDPVFASFITNLMLEEIAPSIVSPGIHLEKAREYAHTVLDRFRNPYIKHQWISIALQYSAKMAMRNKPLIKSWFAQHGSVPPLMSLGLAAWILFMKTEMMNDGHYVGKVNGEEYEVKDDLASRLYAAWKAGKDEVLVREILSSREIWQEDLSLLPGLTIEVTQSLNLLINAGVMAAMMETLQGAGYKIETIFNEKI